MAARAPTWKLYLTMKSINENMFFLSRMMLNVRSIALHYTNVKNLFT